MLTRIKLMFLAAMLVALGLLGGSALSAAQTSDKIWSDVSESSINVKGARRIVPEKYRTLALDSTALTSKLAQAPLESYAARNNGIALTLPIPDGSFSTFRVVEAPIMAPALAARYPQIKTYLGQGVDDPAAIVRFDRTPAGFHAMILSSNGTVYIDPYSDGDTTHYISYYRRDFTRPADKAFTELGVDLDVPSQAGSKSTDIPSGPVLRTYRLVVAATGEYTAFHGGTVASAMAAIVTSVNRVVGVYEREVAVRMILVPNNDTVVYTNPTTDPYTNEDGFAMLFQNQANLDVMIGPTNYDIGHVFSTGGGGVAGLGVVCNIAEKAQGVTGSSAPVGDPFDIDYVAHEMGHQFGGNHTFNGSTGACGGGNRNGPTAYEPGSGSTIMAYAGICGSEDLQPHSDPFFHVGSYDEMVEFTVNGGGNACAVQSNTGNNAPLVDAGPGYTIPVSTSFKLTGAASDPDGDALTYNWEQLDAGAEAPPNTDDGTRAIFRSFEPLNTTTRIFPRLSDIISNTLTFGEALPATNRNLTFRMTVRDNRAGGGGVEYDTVEITSTTSAGPFHVVAPNVGLTWEGNSLENVVWAVANTNMAPVSCGMVDVTLSTDGGHTFGTILAEGTANDGIELITVPNVVTNQARVQVSCASNIFFDMSDVNFNIILGATPTGTPPTGTPTRTSTSTPVLGTPATSTSTSTVMPPATAQPSTTATSGIPTTQASPTVTTCSVQFTDVPASNTFYSQIRCLACQGIMGGYSDGTFRPNNNVTRGQLSKIVANSAGFNEPVSEQTFEDVPSSNTFYPYIERMAGRGIIGGYPCGGVSEPCGSGKPYFRPNANATRGQISKIVSEAADYNDPQTGQTFEDVPSSNTFHLWIERLASRGIMSGYPCGGTGEPCGTGDKPYFRPNNNATRGQTSKIVANTFFPTCEARR
jgi:hypothetical protein